MIYLDANVFIFAFLHEDKKTEFCKDILTKVADNEVVALTSALTWDEIVWAARRHLGITDAREEGKKFLEFPYLNIMDTTATIIRIAQNITNKYDLKPRDAIHTATALSSGITKLVSDDPDFDAVKEIRRIPLEKFR